MPRAWQSSTGQGRRSNELSDHTNLLVLGSPRSGTTLLSAMLSCHPEIALLNEDLSGAFTRIFSKRFRGVKLCAPHQIEMRHTATTRAGDFSRGQIRRLTNIVRRAAGRPVPLGGFYKARHSIEDMRAMPEPLHVIGIVRSADDVIASIMKRGRQKEETARYRWVRLIQILNELARVEDADFALTLVRFDDLVAQPAETLTAVLRALQLDFDPRVMEGFKHTPQYQGRTGIDAQRAGGGLDDDLSQAVLRNDPELAAAYRRLHELALEPGKE